MMHFLAVGKPIKSIFITINVKAKPRSPKIDGTKLSLPLSVIADHGENHITSKRPISKTHKSLYITQEKANKILKSAKVDTDQGSVE